MKNETHAFRRALADAYKNTEAKLILNFGKTVVPAIRAWADVASEYNVSQTCDHECAVACFDPRHGSRWEKE